MQNLNRFMDSGYLFKNCFTQNPWANLSFWISKIPKEIFEKSNYALIGHKWNIQGLRKISAENNLNLPPNFYFFIPSEPKEFDQKFL